MKRCFIAIAIPAENSLFKFYTLLIQHFAVSVINWVKPENFHLTLVFLGEIPDKQIDTTIRLMNDISMKFAPFGCELKGFGSFGSRENPTVLWIGIHASQTLIKLKTQLDAGLNLTGYKPNEKIFRPHLTLGRIKVFKNHLELLRLTSKFKDHSFLNFKVNTLILYESKLSASGPFYSPLQACPLKG